MARSNWVIAGLAIVGVGALVATGFQNVPDSGQVRTGLSDLSQVEQPVVYDAVGPQDGATQEDILRGFLQAAASPDENYAVAREFLSPSYADLWSPTAGILVDSGTREFKQSEANIVTVVTQQLGRVDNHGLLTNSVAGTQAELRFEFERIGEQWRIASAPTGIVLEKTVFTSLLNAYTLYFPDGKGDMIAEERWFAKRSRAATQIVQALIAGPSEQFAEIAHTEFPANSKLIGNTVTIVDGRAKIDMSSALSAVTGAARERLITQLSRSLVGVPNVDTFELAIEGVELTEKRVENISSGRADRAAYVLTDDRVIVQRGTELGQELSYSSLIANAKPSTVSLRSDGRAAAMLTGQGLVYATDQGTQLLSGGSGFLPPSIDRWGFVWSSVTGSRELYVWHPDQRAKILELPELPGQLVQFRVSPDGYRLAVMLQVETVTQAQVLSIVRSETNEPSFTAASPVLAMSASGSAVDMDWVDNEHVAVISGSSETKAITVGGTGLFSSSRGSLSGALRITGVDGSSGIRVLTSSGELFQPRGLNGWQQRLKGVDVLVKWG